ncbi:hypothetical protein BV22DRAFT_122724 [Leucogyrophana mollusca]|uniref:Uncharacterized protein n=1 Tax=Leucogyrophana mollusca TaxID=85980 RepID=A0ACB8BXJ5_9AGAM|nr:hypothetical protein BV22DRAFT_122724 [Leucogyrophana mollusca]
MVDDETSDNTHFEVRTSGWPPPVLLIEREAAATRAGNTTRDLTPMWRRIDQSGCELLPNGRETWRWLLGTRADSSRTSKYQGWFDDAAFKFANLQPRATILSECVIAHCKHASTTQKITVFVLSPSLQYTSSVFIKYDTSFSKVGDEGGLRVDQSCTIDESQRWMS